MQNTKMDYYDAEKIRKTGFGQRMLDKQRVAGMGMGGAFMATAGEGLQARAKMMKKYADPMNWLKSIPGFGRNLSVGYGNLRGRSQSDLNYFAGVKKKGRTATPIPMAAEAPTTEVAGNSATVLKEMFKFMQTAREEDKRAREVKQNFDEERNAEEQRRHEDLIQALGGVTATKVVSITKKSDDGGIFDFVKQMLSNAVSGVTRLMGTMIEKVLSGLSWIWGLVALKPLVEAISSFFKSSIYRTLNLLKAASSPKMLGSLLIAAAPMAVLAAITEWAENAKLFDENGNPTAEYSLLDAAQRAMGGKGLTPMADKSKAQRILEGPTNKEARKMWTDRIGLGTEVTQAEADAIKQVFNLEYPTNLIIKPGTRTGSATVDRAPYTVGKIPETPQTTTTTPVEPKIPTLTDIQQSIRESMDSPLIKSIQENIDLKIFEDMDEPSTEATNISMNNNSSTEQVNPYSSTATQRDDTSILNAVLNGYRTHTV